MSDGRPVVNLRHTLPINSFIDGNQNTSVIQRVSI